MIIKGTWVRFSALAADSPYSQNFFGVVKNKPSPESSFVEIVYPSRCRKEFSTTQDGNLAPLSETEETLLKFCLVNEQRISELEQQITFLQEAN